MEKDAADNASSEPISAPTSVSDTASPGSEVSEPIAESQPHTHSPLIHEEKESFASKLSYILVLVGYAVGFGNVWRFPYLMQENGGVVFLIPFVICMAFLGIPVFYLELAVGQRLRKSALHAWTEVSPYLSGIAVAGGGACIILGYYYTTLIAWCLYYFFSSFQGPLPWRDCDVAEVTCCKDPNGTLCARCKQTGASTHFWYDVVTKISGSINEPGQFNWGIAGCLLLAWLLTWGILVRGIKASGQVAYVTALLPYFVLTIFLIRGLTLDGMAVGYEVVFTPDWAKLLQAKIWFTAGTQVFFNFGLGFGLLVSFSALLPANNNCYRDCLSVALINFATSLLAASVIFPTLGFKGTKEFNACVKQNEHISYLKWIENSKIVLGPKEAALAASIAGPPRWTGSDHRTLVWHFDNDSRTKDRVVCDLLSSVRASASGTGLIYIAYAEAISQFEASQFWAILFFVMILTLGIDSGFTTVEGAVIMVHQWNIFNLNLKKWKITTGVCAVLWLASFLFAFGWAEYMVTFIDEFTTNWTLLIIGFFECVGVAWVYGLKRFSYDIHMMTGHRPNLYMLLCWRFFSPVIMFGLFIATVVDYFTKEDSLMYQVFNHTLGKKENVKWPSHAVGVGFFILLLAVGAVPLFAILTKFKIRVIKDQPPAEFPEEELCTQHNITDAYLDRPESWIEKALYWGIPADLHRHNTAEPAPEPAADANAYEGTYSPESPQSPEPSEPAT